jgi:hypothetical protein
LDDGRLPGPADDILDKTHDEPLLKPEFAFWARWPVSLCPSVMVIFQTSLRASLLMIFRTRCVANLLASPMMVFWTRLALKARLRLGMILQLGLRLNVQGTDH